MVFTWFLEATCQKHCKNQWFLMVLQVSEDPLRSYNQKRLYLAPLETSNESIDFEENERFVEAPATIEGKGQQ